MKPNEFKPRQAEKKHDYSLDAIGVCLWFVILSWISPLNPYRHFEPDDNRLYIYMVISAVIAGRIAVLLYRLGKAFFKKGGAENEPSEETYQ